jgi:hypothetical protein
MNDLSCTALMLHAFAVGYVSSLAEYFFGLMKIGLVVKVKWV